MYLNDIFTVTVNMADCLESQSQRPRPQGLPLACNLSAAFEEETLFALGAVIDRRRAISRRTNGGSGVSGPGAAQPV